MGAILETLRHAFRGLRRNPGFSIIVIATLGLGLGADIAVFAVIESVLLRPLPFPAPERLVSISTLSRNGASRIGTSGPEFKDYKEQSRSFEDIAEVAPQFTYTWTGEGGPRTVKCTGISYDFFPMLGLKPYLGRVYTPDEYHVDGVQVVISEHFWKEQLGGDPHVIGRVLNLDGTPQVVIGVMPPVPDLFPDTDIWAKLVPNFRWMQMRGNKFLTLIGRLRPGTTDAVAEQELSGILHRGPGESPDSSVQVTPLKDELVGKVRAQLELVMGAVTVLLLITCVNVTYLLLARNTKRQTEIAVRLSIGATRGHMLMQFIVENLVLACLGGGVGLVLATEGVKLLRTLNAGMLPRTNAIRLDAHVFGFVVIVTIAVSLFIAWIPSIAFTRIPLYSALKMGRGQNIKLSKSHFRALIVSEVSLSMVLLVGAGLLLRSFWRVVHLAPGFKTDHLLTAYLRTNDTSAGRKFFLTLLQRSADVAGVQASALSDCMPARSAGAATLKFDDRANDPYKIPTVQCCWISPSYFYAIGTPMMAGRSFSIRDDENGPPVVIVNKAMADLYWPGTTAIGKQISADPVGAGRGLSEIPVFREVVGIVGDIHQKGLEGAVEPSVYMPFQQDQTNHVFASLNWFVRTQGDPRAFIGTLRSLAGEIGPAQPIERMQTMEDGLSTILAPRRFVMSLFESFAGLALFHAAIGIFGMVAYAVSQRTRELGIRLALGAQPADIRRLVLKDGLLLALVGVIVGVLTAGLLTRAMSALLFGVTALDPLSFIIAGITLLLVAGTASLLPAWRASSLDPVKALNIE